jgi:hypothetical protein
MKADRRISTTLIQRNSDDVIGRHHHGVLRLDQIELRRPVTGHALERISEQFESIEERPPHRAWGADASLW